MFNPCKVQVHFSLRFRQLSYFRVSFTNEQQSLACFDNKRQRTDSTDHTVSDYVRFELVGNGRDCCTYWNYLISVCDIYQFFLRLIEETFLFVLKTHTRRIVHMYVTLRLALWYVKSCSPPFVTSGNFWVCVIRGTKIIT